MLRISVISGTLRVNGEEVGDTAFKIIFGEALGLTTFANVCDELAEKGVSVVDISPVARSALFETLSRAEAAHAIQVISNSHEAIGDAIEKLSEIMTVLPSPELMMILQLIAAQKDK